MAAPGSSLQALPRPPTGALRPPVAIGPADIDDGDNLNRKAPVPAPGGSALSLPSAEVLRPPVAMGPSDMDNGDGSFRRGLVDRNLSMSSKTSFRTEGSGYTPWTYTPVRVASGDEADGARRMGAPGYIGESMAVSGGWGIAETGFDPANVNLGSQSRRSRDSPPRAAPQRPPEGFADAAAKNASVGFNPMVVSIQLPPETDRTGELQNYVSGGALASSAPVGPNIQGSVSAREWARGGMGNLDAGLSRGRSASTADPYGSPRKSPPGHLAAAALTPSPSNLPPGARWAPPAPSRTDARSVPLHQAPIAIDRPQPFSALPRASSRSNSLERAGSWAAPAPAGEGQDLLYREQQYKASQDDYRRSVAFSLAEEWATNSRPFEVSRTPVITYPGGMSVKFQDHAYSFMHVATANAANRSRIIQTIESGQFLFTALEIYKACDPQMNGFLSWNDGEIVNFIARVFQQFGLTPPSESQIFQLYAQFDFDRSMFLGARECLCLADAIFRAMFLFEALNIPPATSNLGTPGLHNLSRAPSSGPTAATFILTPPPSDGGVVAYNPDRLPPPPSWQWPHMASPGDIEADGRNDMPPGYVMPGAEAPKRQQGPGAGEWPVSDWSWAEIGSLFGFKKGGQPKQKPMAPAPPPVDAGFGWPGAAPGPAAGPAEFQARPYQIFRAPGGDDGGQVMQDWPDSAVNAPAAHLWPDEAWSWRGLGSLFAPQGSPQQQRRGPPAAQAGNLAAQCPACGNVFMEGSNFCRRCGLKRPEERGAPPADPPSSRRQPSYKKADIDPRLMSADPDSIIPSMPQASPNMPTRPPPAPEVPKWRAEVELRKHILEVDLEELRISMHSPDMMPSWYQSTSYYLSLHPTAEPPDAIALPMDAPSHTVPGKHLVSRSQTSKKPPVDNGHGQAAAFKEKLKLETEYLDQTLAGFVWGKKASLTSEELVLIGTFAVPLFDFKLQRKVVPWKVMDSTVDKPIGEVLMRHEVMTTPGPVQLPLLSEVKRNEVSIHWTPPLNDHGSPIIGYKIAILVTPKLEGGLLSKLALQGAETGPQWVTLDDCTKALTPAYVIKELEGNTSYMVNIQAVNVVGAGDPCEFQIQTAPVEPSAPKKPWIQEARDGCLCVAWHAPDNDGGSQITAYRVQMMKNVGMASRIMAAFGHAAEGDAAWVNMGTVGAVMDEVKDQPSVYTVWAGPLDTQKCEYRFRVFAINAAGVSRESVCTDPHYT